jgi:ABC-type glycerol-3-phosphate transport system substrate-binding protein
VAVALFLGGYLTAVCWVFTRTVPLTDRRPITIRIAHWQIELGPPEGMAAVIQRYEALHPDVRVKQELIPSSVYRQWLRSNFSGGTAPDIVEYGAWLDGLADFPARYFEPLTTELMAPNPYNAGTPLAGRPWLKTFVDELLEQRLNSPEPGQYYAITLTRGSIRFFCNRDLLREVTGSTEPPRTLEDLRRLFGQVKMHAVRTGRLRHALAGSRDNAMWLMTYYMSGLTNRLGHTLDREGVHTIYPRQMLRAYLRGDCDFSHPDLHVGLAVLQEFSRQMRPGFLQLSRDEAVREFLAGDALLIFAGTWDATTLRRSANFPVDVLRLPQATPDDPVVGPQIIGPFSDGDNTTSFGFYLNRDSPNREVAVDFLRFLTSHASSQLFMEKSGWVSGIDTVPVPEELAPCLSPGDGYGYNANLMYSGPHMRMNFERNLHLLTGPEGSVTRLAAQLEAEAPAAVRADLRAEQRSANVVVLPQDARIAALGMLADEAGSGPEARRRREGLEAAQTQSEARALMIGNWLRAADGG